MTNIFRILWFEDNSSWYNMESRKVKRHLKESYCLEFGPVRSIGTDFDFEQLKQDNNYDLILMDYVLAAGNTGKKMIDLIRSNAVLTDVLLYSSEYDKMIVELKADNPLIDGVFFADRKNELFEEKLFGIIHKIVRRSEDIVNLRGFFLDNTSDFEIRIKELLKLAWDKLPEAHERLNAAMEESLRNIEGFTSATLKEIRSNTPVYEHANNHKYALSIRNRVQILSEIISVLVELKKVAVPTDYRELEDFSKYYSEDISLYRNALGHKKYSDTSLQIKGKIITIDDSLHKKLRDNINKYDGLIGYLEDVMSSL